MEEDCYCGCGADGGGGVEGGGHCESICDVVGEIGAGEY